MNKTTHLLLGLFSLAIFQAPAKSELTHQTLQPRPLESFNLSLIQTVGSCSYTVIVSTSCSSPRYTRDEIGLAFGDAYGNQIYSPRIDFPSSRTFEQCLSDTFQLTGPCAYQICYAYVYRTGPDGWMPESVTIYGYNSGTATFVYNTYVPSAVWFGVNLCHNASSSFSISPGGLLGCLILLAVIGCLLLYKCSTKADIYHDRSFSAFPSGLLFSLSSVSASSPFRLFGSVSKLSRVGFSVPVTLA